MTVPFRAFRILVGGTVPFRSVPDFSNHPVYPRTKIKRTRIGGGSLVEEGAGQAELLLLENRPCRPREIIPQIINK